MTQTRYVNKSQTVRMTLEKAIDKHGIAEVIERLTDICYAHAQTAEHPEIAEGWKEITRLLEQATERSLELPID